MITKSTSEAPVASFRAYEPSKAVAKIPGWLAAHRLNSLKN